MSENEIEDHVHIEHTMQQIAQIPATAFLELFITNEDQRNRFIDQVISSLEAGTLSPIKAYVGVKALGKLVDSLTDKNDQKNKRSDAAKFFMDCVLSEAGHYGKKFEFLGAKCEQKEVGVKYDFSLCGDEKLVELEASAKQATEDLKKRQDFLKTVPVSGLDILNSETGETYKIYPPAKSSTTTLTVSI